MRSVILILICLFFVRAGAQNSGKQPLTIEDFGGWNVIAHPVISNNGSFVAFEQNPRKGDGMLVIQREESVFDTIPRGHQAAFGPENDFIAFSVKQPEDTIRKAKLDEVKKEDMPKDSLGIWIFNDAKMYKFPKLKSFKVPEENARWVAFSTEPEPAPKDTTGNRAKKKNGKNEADNLVLFQVGTGDTLLFRNVSGWQYAKKGGALYFSREVKDSAVTVSSLFAFDTSDGTVSQLFSEEGFIKKTATDEQGEQYAFLFSSDTIPGKVYSLYFGHRREAPREIVDNYTRGIPVGWSPGEHGPVYFSEDGTRLYLGTAESPEPAPKDTIPEDEKPKLDIWNWQDLKLQSQQKVEAEREKKRTYLAVYHIDLNRFIQLADPTWRGVSLTQKGDGDIGLAYNELPYLRAFSWTGRRDRDYAVVDLTSGIKREIVEGKSYVRISPQGNYVVWYDPADSSYYARSTDSDRPDTIPLTKMLPVNFCDELNDRPIDPSPYGIAGWSNGGRFVYIYDRYDLWKIDPSGERVPVNITKAYGRRNQIRLRYVNLDPEREYIPSDEPVLLRGFDEKTMKGGFYRARFRGVADPEELMLEKKHFARVSKAKNAGKIIWTREDVREYPDLWCSDTNFMNRERISHANPQQKNFIWPKVQLVEWTSLSGEKLKGLLYLPENLDPVKKYPLMVYFYERNAENLYRHTSPAPSRSVINRPFYVSNNYIVFVPDITYREGYPGQSAYDAIVSGTQYLINTFPYIDEKSMGLQGQSWGGYQTAYLITQTDMYAAAMAGAPVSNMTSAYGGIRWATGLSRMFQYEQTQSRIGGSLWEKPLHYIENSPLFYAPKVNTPLLMMHNDQDGAVPWYQGIEFFVALRRLDKPVWLLTYNGEPHNLKASSWANRVDLSRRMFGFFNHYLKGEPMPEWMKKGVPAVEKGENLGY